MNDGTALYTIGDLARRTGLNVRTIRYYSDLGVVPPTDRSPAGYRLYDIDALARLDLVRTLRDLGVDLAAIQRVLAHESTVAEVAAAHVGALDAQIRTLRLRRAVLRAVAKRGSTPEELELMHKLAKLSDAERRRIIEDFVDVTFEGLDADPRFVSMMRSAVPALPDDPTAEQVDAWVELAELVRDDGFRASIRRIAEGYAADRAAGSAELDDPERAQQFAQAVADHAGPAQAAGLDPASAEARPIVDELAATSAETFGRSDDAAFRVWLADRIETGSDVRNERYWRLLGIINGWPPKPDLVPAWDWFAAGLRAHHG